MKKLFVNLFCACLPTRHLRHAVRKACFKVSEKQQHSIRMNGYRQLAEKYLSESKIEAYHHAIQYINIAGGGGLPRLLGIELCNICNLSCPNCPTPTTKQLRGYATDETVDYAIKLTPPGGTLSLHGRGEPLLHENFLSHARKVLDRGLNLCVSTNGLLLSEEIGRSIIEMGFSGIFYITLHTKKSVKSFLEFLRLYKEYSCVFTFHGIVLSHNRENALKWLQEYSAGDDYSKFLLDVRTHSWAGNVGQRKQASEWAKNIRSCPYIHDNAVLAKWDGTIVACCLDAENETMLGNIHEFDKVKHSMKGYPFCKYCDLPWISGNNE